MLADVLKGNNKLAFYQIVPDSIYDDEIEYEIDVHDISDSEYYLLSKERVEKHWNDFFNEDNFDVSDFEGELFVFDRSPLVKVYQMKNGSFVEFQDEYPPHTWMKEIEPNHNGHRMIRLKAPNVSGVHIYVKYRDVWIPEHHYFSIHLYDAYKVKGYEWEKPSYYEKYIKI